MKLLCSNIFATCSAFHILHLVLFGTLSYCKRQRVSKARNRCLTDLNNVLWAQFSTPICFLKHPPKHLHNATSPRLPVGTARTVAAKKGAVTFRQKRPSWGCSVGFVRGQQGCVYRLHAGRAGEGAHQPGVNAIDVVNMKAGQEPDGITVLKIHHADHTLFNFLVRGVWAWVEDAFGQVMDEADSLSNADLLLFGQLVSQTALPWGGMVHWHRLGALLVGRRRLSGQTAPLGLVQQRQVIRTLWKQAVPHWTGTTMSESAWLGGRQTLS